MLSGQPQIVSTNAVHWAARLAFHAHSLTETDYRHEKLNPVMAGDVDEFPRLSTQDTTHGKGRGRR